jgi:hypothetical protein
MYKLFYQSIIYMVSFGKKLVRGFNTFGKKLNEEFGKNKLGRKIANTLKTGLNVVEDIAGKLPMNPVSQAVMAGTQAGKNILGEVRRGVNRSAADLGRGIENVKSARDTAVNAANNAKNELERAKARVMPAVQQFY